MIEKTRNVFCPRCGTEYQKFVLGRVTRCACCNLKLYAFVRNVSGHEVLTLLTEQEESEPRYTLDPVLEGV